MSLRTFSGGVVIITGGASGIGRAVGEELARRGAEVVLADVDLAGAETVARAIGSKATAAHLDVRDFDAAARLVADTMRRTGRIDYVFNNAGSGVFGEAHLYDARDWDFLIDLNIRGVVNVMRAVYPRMIEQGFGHLVNTASLAGLMTTPFLSAYAATKHAVVGMSKSMRVEAMRYGVRVSVLCPGAIKTPLLEGGAHGRTVYDLPPARMLEWWKMMKPEDVGVFAKQAIDAVAKNRGVIVLPNRSAAFARLFRLFPALEERLARKLSDLTFARFPEVSRGKKKTNGVAHTGATPT